MPLSSGTTRSAFESNVSELIKSGYKKDQAVAIAIKKLKDAGGTYPPKD